MSDYYNKLDASTKNIYLEKLRILATDGEVVDPYVLDLASCNVTLENFPRVMYPDISNYLLHTKGAYSLEEMKAYKSMEAYNQASCGWVKKVATKDFGEFTLVLGKVMHSQRLNEKLLSSWIICKKGGEIITAHCDCVAGVGGACSHVAAILFSIEMELRKLEDTTVTGVKAYWMPPSNQPTVPKRIHDIDLRTAKKKFLEENVLFRRETAKINEAIPPMSTFEKKQFLDRLEKETTRGCVAHSITFPFAYTVKKRIEERRSLSLLANYQPELEDKPLEELKCSPFKLRLTIDDCKFIEAQTRNQSKCKAWFSYRAGRVTASKFKSCCRTKIEKPSLSLIKSICYPVTYSSKIKSLLYGCCHEKDAMKDFLKKYKKDHENVGVDPCGLFINVNYPYFGASPDGILECSCCGISLVEIKCPYCARRTGVIDLIDEKGFYLKFKDDGKIVIDENHAYYYQVQMQLALTKQKRCYLVVWSKKNLVYTKVDFNEEFWARESKKAERFFFEILVPEIKGKYFTKKDSTSHSIESSDDQLPASFTTYPTDLNESHEELDCVLLSSDAASDDENEASPATVSVKVDETTQHLSTSLNAEDNEPSDPLYCICQKADDGVTPLIACDSGFCEIEWYHMNCMNLDEIPSVIWICPFCK